MRIRGYEGLYSWLQWREALIASQSASGSNIGQLQQSATETSEQSDASSAMHLLLQRSGGVSVWRPPPSGELRNIAMHALNQLMEAMPLQNAEQLTFLKVRAPSQRSCICVGGARSDTVVVRRRTVFDTHR
jgi:hypothetical protein